MSKLPQFSSKRFRKLQKPPGTSDLRPPTSNSTTSLLQGFRFAQVLTPSTSYVKVQRRLSSVECSSLSCWFQRICTGPVLGHWPNRRKAFKKTGFWLINTDVMEQKKNQNGTLYVCMCVCVCNYVCTYVYVYLCACVYVYVHVRCMCICLCFGICVQICMCIGLCICQRVCIGKCMCT